MYLLCNGHEEILSRHPYHRVPHVSFTLRWGSLTFNRCPEISPYMYEFNLWRAEAIFVYRRSNLEWFSDEHAQLISGTQKCETDFLIPLKAQYLRLKLGGILLKTHDSCERAAFSWDAGTVQKTTRTGFKSSDPGLRVTILPLIFFCCDSICYYFVPLCFSHSLLLSTSAV